MKLTIVFAAIGIFGCQNAHSGGSTGSVLDGNVEEGAPDSGHVIDESPPTLDAGDTPDADVANDERDASDPEDAGHPLVDAAVRDDAGDMPDEDASVAMCTDDLSVPATLGTAEAPIELAAGDLPFVGEIDWRGRAFARITGVTPGERYAITASATSKLTLAVFPDDTTFTEAACVMGDGGDEFSALCLATATSTSIGVTVDAAYRSETFTLTIRPTYHSEGTSMSPVQVAATALPYDLEVSSEVANFYEITGLTPAVPYVVSAHASSDAVQLIVFGSETAPGAVPQGNRILISGI